MEHSLDTGALQRLLLALTTGGHACVCGEDDERPSSLLECAGRLLPKLGVRVVRTAAAGLQELSLPDLVNQIVDQWQPEIGGEDRLERAFLTLTAAGGACSHVALLIENAQQLAPAAVHYLTLTSQSGPPLRIVLAGGPRLSEALGRPEFGWLRQRFACELRLPALPNAASALASRLPSLAQSSLSSSEPVPTTVRTFSLRDARSGQRKRLAAALSAFAVAVAASFLVELRVPPRDGDLNPKRPGDRMLLEVARVGDESNAIGPLPALEGPGSAPIAMALQAAPEPIERLAPLQDGVASAPEPATIAGPGAPPAVGDPEWPPTPATVPRADLEVISADLPKMVPASPSGQIAVVPSPPMAASEAPVPVTNSDAEIDATAPAPPAIAALTPVPVLLRSPGAHDWPSPPPAPHHTRASARLGSDSAVGTSAAQRCRAIVIRTQLGEDPSNADREFLRRGCPTEH